MSITIEKVNTFYEKQQALADVFLFVKKRGGSWFFRPNGSWAVKDNWDLRVMRATAVTKILTNGLILNKLHQLAEVNICLLMKKSLLKPGKRIGERKLS